MTMFEGACGKYTSEKLPSHTRRHLSTHSSIDEHLEPNATKEVSRKFYRAGSSIESPIRIGDEGEGSNDDMEVIPRATAEASVQPI